MLEKEIIKINDSKDFLYEVEFKYLPHFGSVFAYYQDNIIADVQYSRIAQPIGDNDRDWERYEEAVSEFVEQSHVDLIPKCKSYFDLKY